MEQGEDNRSFRKTTKFLMCFLAASIISLIGINIFVYHKTKKHMPKVEQVQQGFLEPSKLEVVCIDKDKSDGEGLPETYMKIYDKIYTLKCDSKGIPIISVCNIPYKFEGDKTIPNNDEVQKGFVKPSELDIICNDYDKSDGKGLKETYMTIGKHIYALKQDKNGKPFLEIYKKAIKQGGFQND